MSRARAAADRIPQDGYQTPAPLARAICQRLFQSFAPPGLIVEPSAGTGAFVAAAKATWPDAVLLAVEVEARYRKALERAGAAGGNVTIGDWVTVASRLFAHLQPAALPPRLVVGNPPYRQAQAHIEAALEWLRPGDLLAFLLRLNFLGSRHRISFWKRPGLLWVATITPRPSFTGGGTDGTEYALFVWRKGYRGEPRLAPTLTWEPERKRKRVVRRAVVPFLARRAV